MKWNFHHDEGDTATARHHGFRLRVGHNGEDYSWEVTPAGRDRPVASGKRRDYGEALDAAVSAAEECES